MLGGPLPDLAEQIVDLAPDGADRHHRIDQEGGTDDLFHHHSAREPEFQVPRGRGDVDHDRRQLHELVEMERPVVERRREPEPVVDQGGLPGTIAIEHPPDLRQRDM